jgi:protein-L-isoaspartate(D-aspartate) O-methyltransferase
MVDALQRSGLLVDPELARAVEKVPREMLLPETLAQQAYVDAPLTLGWAAYEPSPIVQIAMVQAGRVGRGQTVLDLEPGIGYRAALCDALGGRVYCLVQSPNHKHTLEANLARAHASNVVVEIGEETSGLAKYGQYNVLMGRWAAREVPEVIVDQVRNQGRIVLLPAPQRDRIEVLKSQKGTLSLVETIEVMRLSQTYASFLSTLQ